MPEPNPSHGLVPGPTGPPAEGVPGSSEKDANLPADSETKPAIPDLNTSELSAIAIVDKWTEATEEEEALDQWGALNAMSSLVSDRFQADNDDAVTNGDSALDAVEQWTHEQEDSAIESGSVSDKSAGDGETAPTPEDSIAQPVAVATAAGAGTVAQIALATQEEVERLRFALQQAQQEIEALETSTNLYRLQLKQAKEVQRVRTMEVETERSSNESALENALRTQRELKELLASGEQTQAKMAALLEEKEAELKALKLENHEYPSRILKLQAEVDAEKAKFKSLVDRFNSIKELELHRQKQKFLAVSAQQKEVFNRLMTRFNDSVKVTQAQADTIQQLRAQVGARDEEIVKLQAIVAQARHEISAKASDCAQLTALVSQLKAERDQTLASKEAAINDIEQKLHTFEDIVRTVREREEEQNRMKCYFESPHDAEPEVGDEIRVRYHDCGEVVQYEWFRSSPSNVSAFERLNGQSKETHTASADDLGCVIKCTLTNTTGLTVSGEVGPIVLPSALAKSVHEALTSKKDIEFCIKNASDSSSKGSKMLVLTKEKVKVREGKTTNVKEPYSDNVNITLSTSDDLRFALVLKENGPQMEFVALSPQARNLIVMTVRAVNHVVANKQQYKEKDANTSFIQYLLSSAAPKPKDSTKERSRHGSLSYASKPKKSFLEEALEAPASRISRHPSAAIPSNDHTRNNSLSSGRGNGTQTRKSTAEIQYDEDGYIIRKEQNDRIDEFREDDDEPSQPNIVPIVIKPKSEAVEATSEELSRAAIKFDKPPVASSSKPKPAPKKKKKGTKAPSRNPTADEKGPDNPTTTPEPSPRRTSSSSRGSIPQIVVDAPVTSASSPRLPAAQERTITASVAETVSCCMVGGIASGVEVVGMVTLAVEPVSPDTITAGLRLKNTDALKEVMANAKAVEELSEFVYKTQIAPNTTSVPVLRYTTDVDAERFPIRVTTGHTVSESEIDLVVDVTGTAVDTVSLLMTISPPGCVQSLLAASPASCMFDIEQQRVCWKSVPVEPRFTAKLRLAPGHGPPVISPVLVQFTRSRQSLSDVVVVVDDSDSYARREPRVSVTTKVFQAL
ncbi:Muniscin C-terminal domain-containing protein [Plasmodiophora brassicae]